MNDTPCPYTRMILVCLNERPGGEPACGARNARPTFDALKAAVATAGLKETVRVTKTGCLGPCDLGPNIVVVPEGRLLSGVGPGDVPAILKSCVQTEM